MSGIVIHRSRHAQEYVVIPNALARNRGLSFTARGLLAMLLSLPPEWHVTVDLLAEDNPDSRSAIRKAMRELREAGYVEVHNEQGARGRWSKRIEVFDTLPAERGHPALGATSGNSVSSQVAPNAGGPTFGGPTFGGAALKRSKGSKYRSNLSPRDADLRAELARLGADERETGYILTKISNDRRIRDPAAYLGAALSNGDGPKLIGVARRALGAGEPAAARKPAARPPWCGTCDERTRLTELDDGRMARCSQCHPISAGARP